MRALFHADPDEASRTSVGAFWVLLLCAVVAWAYVRTAAVTEDAFITFRVIDNALHGYGLDRKSTRLNSSHLRLSRMPSSA